MEATILFPEITSYGFVDQRNHLPIATSKISRSRRRRLNKKGKFRYLKKSSEDLGVAAPLSDSSAVPLRVQLIRKEGASELPPSVAPPPCLSNSDEDAVMKSESPVQNLKSNQNFDMPSLSDSKGKANPSDSGTINLPYGMLWDVDKPPLKKRMKRPEVSSFTAQGCRYCLRPHR